MKLYKLLITDRETADIFDIGIFATRAQAEQTATRYLQSVQGFCEFSCTYSVLEKEIAASETPDTVWMAQGWNEYDADGIESDCFLTEAEALAALLKLQREYDREEWTVNRYAVGKAEWQEGFCRQ